MKLLKFQADWCGPCKALTKTLATTSIHIDQVVDVDTDKDIARRYNIRGVPTLILTDDSGKEIKRVSGNISKETLLREFQ